MENIIMRKAKPEDANAFSEIILLASPVFTPYIYGSNVRGLMEYLFRHTRNHFSFEHAYFLEIDNKVAGMALMFDYKQKRREGLRTHLLMLTYLKWSFFTKIPYLCRIERVIGKITRDECYVRYIAVYPEFRRHGLGTKCLMMLEKEVRKRGNKRIALDVNIDNKEAIRLYETLGYRIAQKSPVFKIKDKKFEFFRMSKDIEKEGNIA